MATRPTDTRPLWAESSSYVTEPSGTERGIGWVPTIPPPASWMNWMMRSVGRWVNYFAEFKIDPAADGVRWGYETAQTFRSDVPAHAFHPTGKSTSADYRMSGDWGQSTDNTIAGYGMAPLPHLPWLEANRATYRATGLRVYGHNTDAASSIILYLKRQPKNAAGSGTAVASVTLSGITGGIIYADAVMGAHTIDHTYWYWLEVRVDPGTVSNDTMFYGAELTYTKNAVE